MNNINLTLINQDNVAVLRPLLAHPELLTAAGLTYSPTMGLLGFQLIAKRERLFAITVNGETAGILLLTHRYRGDGQIIPDRMEIGYAVLPDFQHQGVATRAVQQLIIHLKQRPGSIALIAEIAIGNHRSTAVVERCGFRPIGVCQGVQHWELHI